MRVYVCEDSNEVCYNYEQYLKTEHWRLKKKEYSSVYKKECAICGDKKKLHLHHKTYENVGKENLEDLVLLCEKCHYEIHNDECNDMENVENIKKKRILENKPMTYFNFNDNEIIFLPCKIGRECRNSKRKGVVNISGKELFIYCVMAKNKDCTNINIDNIIDLITDKNTNKCALSINTLRKSLKGLEDKGYISIIKGSKRKGIKDIYKLIDIETNRIKLFKVNGMLIDKVVRREITHDDLKVYIRMRYLHNEDVLRCKAKGNIYENKISDIANSLNVTQQHISGVVKKLNENGILDRRKMPIGIDNILYSYEFTFNY